MAMELKRFFSTRAEKVGDRQYKFVISDETKDRHGTVIKVDGWKLDNYKKNPIVLFQHNSYSSDPDMVIGRSEVSISDNKLIAVLTLEPEGDNPIADKLAKKLDFGTINTASVGFNPFEWSMGVSTLGEDLDTFFFRDQDLLEWSLVVIPSNPNATQEKDGEDDIIKFVRMANEETKLPPIKAEVIEEKIIEAVKKLDEHQSRLLRLRVQSL